MFKSGEKLIESNYTANVVSITNSTENFIGNFYNKVIVDIAVNFLFLADKDENYAMFYYIFIFTL